ncbi:MAG: hypothetical protein R6X33_15440 [Candidatus Brocadiia bacterium]
MPTAKPDVEEYPKRGSARLTAAWIAVPALVLLAGIIVDLDRGLRLDPLPLLMLWLAWGVWTRRGAHRVAAVFVCAFYGLMALAAPVIALTTELPPPPSLFFFARGAGPVLLITVSAGWLAAFTVPLVLLLRKRTGAEFARARRSGVSSGTVPVVIVGSLVFVVALFSGAYRTAAAKLATPVESAIVEQRYAPQIERLRQLAHNGYRPGKRGMAEQNRDEELFGKAEILEASVLPRPNYSNIVADRAPDDPAGTMWISGNERELAVGESALDVRLVRHPGGDWHRRLVYRGRVEAIDGTYGGYRILFDAPKLRAALEKNGINQAAGGSN